MKRIILDLEKKPENFKELVQAAFNLDLLNFLVSSETYSELKEIERVSLFSRSVELNKGCRIVSNPNQIPDHIRDGLFFALSKELTSKSDEDVIVNAAKASKFDFIIVAAKDWKVIPFENLIAQLQSYDVDLIARVESIEEAELMMNTLEVGVDGVLIKLSNPDELQQLKKLLFTPFKVSLVPAQVISIQSIPESDRVCIDTTSLMRAGEGMLVGSTSKGFLLVHAEVFDTQFVASRPFRVNAGDVSAYVVVPDQKNQSYRTNYLSELKGGDMVYVVNSQGYTRTVSIGRIKIETRPMLRFQLKISDKRSDISFSTICQNAETIRLVKESGEPISVVDIRVGDRVLAFIGPGATHFGTKIKESIIEK